MTATGTRPEGRRRDPWLHGLLAAAGGGLLGAAAQGTALLGLFGIVFPGLLLVLAAAVLFGGLGALFVSARRGWWLSATVLIWAPAVVASLLAAAALHHGEVDLGSWVPVVGCGGVAGITALLAHRGPPRWAGSLLAIGITAVLVTTAVAAQRSEGIRTAQRALGSTLRPEVLSLAGYLQYGDPTIAGDGTDALVTAYVRRAASDVGAGGFDLAVVTARRTTKVCGGPLLRVGANSTAEPQTSCRRVRDGWRRSSEHGIEYVRRVDGKTTRLLAHAGSSWPDLVLASRTLRPMNDRYYRHLLLGERGSYVPELDGRR